MKLCAQCWKPGEFCKDKNRPDGLNRICKNCASENNRAWREAHPEKERARATRWYQRNYKKHNARMAVWRKTHKEEIREYSDLWLEAHPGYKHSRYEREKAIKGMEAINASRREWKKANPEAIQLQQQRRRAALSGAEYTLTEEEWFEILEYFNYACAYCLRTDLPLTMEHVVPVSQKGGTTAGNIIPACGSCNSKKGARGILCMLRAA